MRVRLTKKLANNLDGVNVQDLRVGDVIDLPGEQARLLVAEEWATPERRERDRADDHPRRRRSDRDPEA